SARFVTRASSLSLNPDPTVPINPCYPAPLRLHLTYSNRSRLPVAPGPNFDSRPELNLEDSYERRIAMNVREVMTSDPVCCVPGDTAQSVAKIICEHNVGSIPVVTDQQSRKLTGIITDRDLSWSIIAQPLDA